MEEASLRLRKPLGVPRIALEVLQAQEATIILRLAFDHTFVALVAVKESSLFPRISLDVPYRTLSHDDKVVDRTRDAHHRVGQLQHSRLSATSTRQHGRRRQHGKALWQQPRRQQ